MGKIGKFLFDKKIRFGYLQNLGFYDKMPDEKFLKKKFKVFMGKELNLENPQTFNEKLQWLKLYDRKPIYTTMVDKYLAKKYIADRIGEEYVIPTLGVYEKFEDIDFDKLPNQFVLKTTHDSGSVVICKDKSTFDIEKARENLNKSLKRDYYLSHREWPYKDVPRRIIAEKYMVDKETNELRDYKFFCFGGRTELVLVCSGRFKEEKLHESFFDIEWNELDICRPDCPKVTTNVKKPINIEKMKNFANLISSNIPFVRIDFYECNEFVYFGEITFFPASGLKSFIPKEWDKKLGDLIDLSL